MPMPSPILRKLLTLYARDSSVAISMEAARNKGQMILKAPDARPSVKYIPGLPQDGGLWHSSNICCSMPGVLGGVSPKVEEGSLSSEKGLISGGCHIPVCLT